MGLEGAEAGGEFGGGEAVLAVEAAEKVGCRGVPLYGVALDTSGDEIAGGVLATVDVRNDVVETASAGSEPSQAVKTEATVAGINGSAKSRSRIRDSSGGDALGSGGASGATAGERR